MASHIWDCLSGYVTNDYAVFLSDEAASCFEVEVESGGSYFSRVLFFLLILQWVVLPKVFQILVIGFVEKFLVWFVVFSGHLSHN